MHLLGDAGAGSTRHLNSVYQDLSLRSPTVKLVYVTPEKLSASDKLISVMNSLYSRGLLDRWVMSLHCDSSIAPYFLPCQFLKISYWLCGYVLWSNLKQSACCNVIYFKIFQAQWFTQGNWQTDMTDYMTNHPPRDRWSIAWLKVSAKQEIGK